MHAFKTPKTFDFTIIHELNFFNSLVDANWALIWKLDYSDCEVIARNRYELVKSFKDIMHIEW